MGNDPLFYVVIFSIFVVLAILVVGLVAFTMGGEFNRKYANKLMRYRIMAQVVAVALILIFVALRRYGG